MHLSSKINVYLGYFQYLILEAQQVPSGCQNPMVNLFH